MKTDTVGFVSKTFEFHFSNFVVLQN